MKSVNRDLLVLTKRATTDKRELELEVEKLHNLLFRAEALENFCVVTEIIDINRYRILREANKVEKFIRQNKVKPFQFICNKN